MKRFSVLFLFVLTVLPARAATNLQPATALLLDEKTVVEMTADFVQYEKLATLKGKLVSGGSGLVTILINRWASEFAALYPDVTLDIEGGGSDASLADFLAGKIDLMPMGRPLNAGEMALFKNKFGYAPAQVDVAQDAVGIYVHKNNPLAGLTLAQLDGIYSGDPKHDNKRPEFWRDLGVEGPLGEERIMRIALSKAQGTHQFFRDAVLLGSDYRFDVHFEAVSSSLVQAVGANEAGIGFASVMWATARTRFVPLGATNGYWLPSFGNVVSGNYPLVRSMRIVFHRKPDGSMNPVAREFLRFAVSRRGQRIIALATSYPLTLQQQRAALRIIGDTSP
jgi:phosphate transport system substrate-binding protein